MYYKNLHPEAPYKLSNICHEFYLVAEGDNISPWAAVEGWRLETCVFDILHNIFLGVARDTVASTLKALVLHGCFVHYGDDENEILSQITVEMRRTCKQHGLLGLFMFLFLLIVLVVVVVVVVDFVDVVFKGQVFLPVQLQSTKFFFHSGFTFHGGGSLSQTWAPLAMKTTRNLVHDSKVLT